MLWRFRLGGRKDIRPVKTEWWGAGVVICLERGADLHMLQLMPVPLTVSGDSKIQIGFTFLVPAHPGSFGQRTVKQLCVCVCVSVSVCMKVALLTGGPSVSVCTSFCSVSRPSMITHRNWSLAIFSTEVSIRANIILIIIKLYFPWCFDFYQRPSWFVGGCSILLLVLGVDGSDVMWQEIGRTCGSVYSCPRPGS